MRHPLLLAVLCSTLALVACDRVAGQSERDRKIAAEQSAIAAYSQKVPEVDTLQARFIEEWKKANEIDELKAFQDGVEAQVVPALEAYVSALRVMPTGTPELGRIHGIVVQAYQGSVIDFRTFVQGLTQDNVEERYKQLLNAMDRVAGAEKTYRDELTAYYAANRVRLVGVGQ